jgi:exosortase/archaeosortase family protein
MPSLLAAAVVMLATWDAWRWYLVRVSAAPEEALALVLAVVLLGALAVTRKSAPVPPRAPPLCTTASLLAAYAASYAVLPPIARAGIAGAAVLLCCYFAAFRRRPPLASYGLTALALPVLPSLQFTLGYPMRIISAALAVPLLQAHGLDVARQGTFLLWRDEMIQFDAPCSGVIMLWAGLLLTLMGCVLLRLHALKAIAAMAVSLALATACNVLRAASLFYIEAHLVPQAPAWWHEAIGIAAFMVMAALTVRLLITLRNCEPRSWRG